ncbi:MAG TPA: (2Fe-2S)-binding protein [Phycisphaerae bacterium]|jgi:bacterioferritin-associated ferredoxin
MKPDDTVCFCFHVSRRKIETFCAVEKPQVASQISECLSAGTGCGWCVPMLRQIHKRLCGEQIPWWRQEAGVDPARGDEEMDAEAYKNGRKAYIKDGKGTPPPGAEI